MAAPADITIKNLNGQWVMDANLSDPTDPILALQGMSWLFRKGLSYATVTLHVHEYKDEHNPAVYHIDVDQVITGGITGTSERRTLDWEEREHADDIFGNLKGRSRMFRGANGRPALDKQTKVGEPEGDARVEKFLLGETLVDGSASEGFLIEDEGAEFGVGEGLFAHSWVVNEESGWSAEQVWGFEIIQGERHYVRRVAVVKDKQIELARLVYTFQERRAED
ncbi:hypothetical protein N7478_006531 [Penicillium angulare]|uniref:uncharacterized protein n=1 Tax=Penicillium angulare TaxID=116970 RepID=UPI0025417642|nr:uncharacterized protein N7478_006531 [Penicillium angulare]KAJ5281159.1 hypothetical protein N7478_006531 [Penicillium angulare]